MSKIVCDCNDIKNCYRNYYLFEQSNDDEFNNEIDYDNFEEYYFDKYLNDDTNKWTLGLYIFE